MLFNGGIVVPASGSGRLYFGPTVPDAFVVAIRLAVSIPIFGSDQVRASVALFSSRPGGSLDEFAAGDQQILSTMLQDGIPAVAIPVAGTYDLVLSRPMVPYRYIGVNVAALTAGDIGVGVSVIVRE